MAVAVPGPGVNVTGVLVGTCDPTTVTGSGVGLEVHVCKGGTVGPGLKVGVFVGVQVGVSVIVGVLLGVFVGGFVGTVVFVGMGVFVGIGVGVSVGVGV